jgi:hypothetical protein
MIGGERSAETRRVRGVKRATREAARPRGKKETRVARASSSAFRKLECGSREGERTVGGGPARTQVLLLELAGQVALHEGGLACVGGERDASGAGQRGFGDPGVGGGSRRGTRDAAGSAIAQILKKTRQACSFPAPTMGRRGGSRTGTAVTDEDQLERGRLSHLSFLRAGAGNVGGQVRHSRGASRRPGEGAARRSEKLMKKRRANPRRDARYAARTSRDGDVRSRDDAPRASMRLPRACKVSERLADSIVSTLKG